MQLLWLVLSPFVCVCLAFLWGLIHPCTFPCSFIQQIYFWAPAYPKRGSNSLNVCEGMNGVVRGCYPSGCGVARLQTLEEGVRLLACEKRTSTHIFSCRIRESEWVEIPCFILLWLWFWFGLLILYDRTSVSNLWLSSCFSLTYHTWFAIVFCFFETGLQIVTWVKYVIQVWLQIHGNPPASRCGCWKYLWEPLCQASHILVLKKKKKQSFTNQGVISFGAPLIQCYYLNVLACYFKERISFILDIFL